MEQTHTHDVYMELVNVEHRKARVCRLWKNSFEELALNRGGLLPIDVITNRFC